MMQMVKSELDQTTDVLTRITDEEFSTHVDEVIPELNPGLGEDSDSVSAEIVADFVLVM